MCNELCTRVSHLSKRHRSDYFAKPPILGLTLFRLNRSLIEPDFTETINDISCETTMPIDINKKKHICKFTGKKWSALSGGQMVGQ